MILQNSTDIKTEYFTDNDGNIDPIDVRYEKHTINPNGLIQLRNIPSLLHTVFYIVRIDGASVTKYNKAETLINQNDFTVDYTNGILTFHNSQVGKEIQVSYTNAIGRLCISADRIFTNIDNMGNVVQSLGTLLDEGQTALSSLSVFGGATKVVTELKGYMNSIRELTGNIIEGSRLNEKLFNSIGIGTEIEANLKLSTTTADNKIVEMNKWVENHGDIVDLDNRINDTEDKLNLTSISLAQIKKNRYFLNDINEIDSILSLMVNGDTLDCAGVYIVDKPIYINKNITIENGVFNYKNNNALRLFNISSPCTIRNVTIDGNIDNQSGGSHYLYDLINVGDTKNVIIENCKLYNSYGGGICVYRSSDCIIKNNIIENIYDNGILIAEKGADRNLIISNIIKNTHVQNCIFLTASSDSTETNNYIYDNQVVNNICRNAGDTSIESGINTVNTLIQGNNLDVKNHPGILLRDCIGFNVCGNTVKQLSSGSSDSISVVPHYKGGTFEAYGVIENNYIYGDIIRSYIGIFQNNVTVKNNRLIYNNSSILLDGSNLKGTGVLTSGNSNLIIENNIISNVDNGVYLNYGDASPITNNIIIKDNNIDTTRKAVNLWNVKLINGDVSNNKILNCYDDMIKDGDGLKTTRVNGNTFYSNKSVTYSHKNVPNNSFIDRKFIKNTTLPLGQYSIVDLININGINGRCLISADNGNYAIFNINSTKINFIEGEGIGIGDGDNFKIIVVSNVLQIQSRINNDSTIKISFIFEG